MREVVSVHPEELRSAAGRFAGQSEALTDLLRDLGTRWPNPDAMCGRDQQGQTFKSAYEPRAEELGLAIGEMARGLCGIADGLRAMASNHQAADTASTVRKPG